MTPAPGPLGRGSMKFAEKMKRYHGEIERLVYAAETVCDGTSEWRCKYKGRPCRFRSDWGDEMIMCDVFALRACIGDHVIRHDIPAVPPIGTCEHDNKQTE